MFEYVIVRWRPNPIVGEFINIGVVLLSEGKLHGKFAQTNERVRKLFPSANYAPYTSKLLERSISRLHNHGGEMAEILWEMMPSEHSVVVFSDVGVGTTDNIPNMLDKLFRQLVDV